MFIVKMLVGGAIRRVAYRFLRRRKNTHQETY
jgi:hypothetical protein